MECDKAASNGVNSISSDLADKLRKQLALHRAEVIQFLQQGHETQLKLLDIRCGQLEQNFIDSVCGGIGEDTDAKVSSQKHGEASEKSKMNPIIPNALNTTSPSAQPAASGSAASESDSKSDPQNSAWAASPKKIACPKEMNKGEMKKTLTDSFAFSQGEDATGYAVTHLTDNTSCWQKFKDAVQTPAFDCCIAGMILLNTIFMAYSTDWVAKNLREPDATWMMAVDLTFTMFFLVDLLIKLLIEKLAFFTGPAKAWNLFDLVVVGIAVMEELLVQVVQSGPSMLSNTKVMRVLRILRLVRVLRVIRAARFFRELRALVYGVMLSFSSLFWSCILGCSTIFIFSVYTTQGVAFFFIEENESGQIASVSDESRDQLKLHCGSLSLTMHTLWKSISGGMDWGDIADPLMQASPTMGFVFTLYIIFCICAILNVVTGVFVNKALKVAEADMDTMILENHASRQDHIKKITNVFKSCDTDKDGRIDADEFAKTCADPSIQAFFRYLELDLDGTDPHVLFNMLDFDGDGVLDSEEFCAGCSVLKGSARSMDLARHTFQFEKKHSQLMESYKDLMTMQRECADEIKVVKDFGHMMQLQNQCSSSPPPQKSADAGCSGSEEPTMNSKVLEQQYAQILQSISQVQSLFQRIAEKANSRSKKNEKAKSSEVEAQEVKSADSQKQNEPGGSEPLVLS